MEAIFDGMQNQSTFEMGKRKLLSRYEKGAGIKPEVKEDLVEQDHQAREVKSA